MGKALLWRTRMLLTNTRDLVDLEAQQLTPVLNLLTRKALLVALVLRQLTLNLKGSTLVQVDSELMPLSLAVKLITCLEIIT